MLLGARIGMSGGGGSPLPYDAEVEYIKVNGAAYIELDYFTGNKLRIQAQVSFGSGTSEQDIINNQDNSTGRFVFGVVSYKFFAYSRSASKSDTNAWSTDFSVGDICSVDCTYDSSSNSKTISVNGTDFTPCTCTTISNTNRKIRVFRNTSGGNAFVGNLYSLKLEKDGAVWFDLIPVRVGDVGYMYDRVSGELFGNDGSGSFTLGPDK